VIEVVCFTWKFSNLWCFFLIFTKYETMSCVGFDPLGKMLQFWTTRNILPCGSLTGCFRCSRVNVRVDAMGLDLTTGNSDSLHLGCSTNATLLTCHARHVQQYMRRNHLFRNARHVELYQSTPGNIVTVRHPSSSSRIGANSYWAISAHNEDTVWQFSDPEKQLKHIYDYESHGKSYEKTQPPKKEIDDFPLTWKYHA